MSVVSRLCIEWNGWGQVDLSYAGLLEIPMAASGWLRDCNSWTVLIIASVSMFWYARNFPPGPSFTYAWLWVGFLSTITRSTDANALFYLIGFGLITGWYTTQVLQRDVWDRLLVYWLAMWPPWCVSTAVRFGDFVIHILPFAYSLQFFKHVGLHHVLQAIIYERVYFLAIENSIIGSGQAANKIYALHPPCGPQVFRSVQMLSTVGYFFAGTVCAGSGRQFLQALWLSLYVFIGFGTVGYFDSVTARFPRDKDSLMTLLADWDEVNEKFATYLQSLKEAVSQSLTGPLSPSDHKTQDPRRLISSSTTPAAAMALLFSIPPPPPHITKNRDRECGLDKDETPSTAPYPPTTKSHRSEFDTWKDLSDFLSYHFPPQLLTTAKEDIYSAARTTTVNSATTHVCAKCQQPSTTADPKGGGNQQHMGDTGGYIISNEEKARIISEHDSMSLRWSTMNKVNADTHQSHHQHHEEQPESIQSLLEKIRSLEDVITKLKTFWALQHRELCNSCDRLQQSNNMLRRPDHSPDHSTTSIQQRIPHQSPAAKRRLPSSRRGCRRMLTRRVTRLEGVLSAEHPSECSTRPSSQNSQRTPHRCTSAATLDSIRSSTSASSSSPVASPSLLPSNCQQPIVVAVEQHVQWKAVTEEEEGPITLDGNGGGGVIQ